MIREDVLQFHDVLALAECLSMRRCPACHHYGTAFRRVIDGMWVCAHCTDWAYRDVRIGQVLYPHPITKED